METVGDFARDGYAIVPTPILPAAVIDRASAGITATLAGMERVTEYTDVVTGKRINGLTTDSHGPPVTLASDGVSELLAHPALFEWSRRITGYAQPRVWWVQYFGKRPDEVEGGYTGLHQDWTSWSQEVNGTADKPNGFSGAGLFTCWVALSEVRPDSAPLQFVRGSHRWGVKYQDKATHRQDRPAQRREIEALREPRAAGQPWEVVSSILPKGGVSFHDWRTVHGSEPNRSGIERRGLAIHLCSEHTVTHGGSLNAYLEDPRCQLASGAHQSRM